ncbi:MAG TPA: hypothetical protein VK338_03030, partial [Candidatus Nitrosocosmicus sp.]|nr:hypothetical protein [Candidatus Nitrosocosmicus sp.]
VLSLVGMILLIIGVFNTIHFIMGNTLHEKYPLRYGNETRCTFQPSGEKGQEQPSRDTCLQDLELERINTKSEDLEKSISFSMIGLLVFSIHFYFARKAKKSE